MVATITVINKMYSLIGMGLDVEAHGSDYFLHQEVLKVQTR